MKPNETHKNTLLREYNEDMLRHAARLAAAEEAEELEQLAEEFSSLPDPEYSEAFQKRMQELFDEAERQERRAKRSRRRPLLRAAACLLGVFVIGGSLMSMSSKGFLEHLKYLAGKSYSTHTEFEGKNRAPEYLKTALAENEWTELLYPSYLPGGFELNDIICTKLRYQLVFSDGEEKFKIYIQEANKNTGYSVDTENVQGKDFYVNGTHAIYVEKQGNRNLVFLHGDYLIVIESTSVNKIQMLDIADSFYSAKLGA